MISDVEARRRNLIVAAAIVVGGVLTAAVYHFGRGQFLGEGYPNDTFLFLRELRFSDFADVLRSAAAGDPYSIWSVYFPFTYIAFRPLLAFPWWLSFAVLFGTCIGHIALRCHRWCVEAGVERTVSIAATAGIVGCAYPMLLCIDRGNIEIVLLSLVVGFLVDVDRGRNWRALVWIVPAMCIKFYPAALLALFLRPKKFGPIVVAGVAFGVISVTSFGLFTRPAVEELASFQQQVARFRQVYLVGNGSMGGSAGPWNAMKLLFLRATVPPEARPVLMAQPLLSADLEFSIQALLRAYSLLVLAVAVYVAYHVARVETDRARQAILLLLFMVLAPPGGADYKMVYVVVALVLATRLGHVRPLERWLVPLLALTLIPKKYYFVPYVITDSGFADVAVSVFVNPLLMITAAGLLCASAWIEARTAAMDGKEA